MISTFMYLIIYRLFNPILVDQNKYTPFPGYYKTKNSLQVQGHLRK